MVREPAVSGQFYPGSRQLLLEEMENLIPANEEKIEAIGAVAPHAGYMYSGAVAGEVYARLKPSKTYVVISPNHTGYGSRFACSSEPWSTPLGNVEVDTDLLAAVMKNYALITEDPSAHLYEHSIEVQLPFIQQIAPGARILPLTVQHGSSGQLQEVADAITLAVKGSSRDVTVIASSDMTHYESRRSAEQKDRLAIQRVLELDPEGLMEVVESKNISMCGYIPVALMLLYARNMNASKSELIRYTDSGEVTGDTDQVVGYAGIIVY